MVKKKRSTTKVGLCPQMVSGVKSFINRHCGESKRCCFSVSLKVGTIIIGLSGLVPGLALAMLVVIEDDVFDQEGLKPPWSTIIVHVYAICGVLIVAVHIILIVASFRYSEKLILLYLWFAVICFIVDLVLRSIIIITALIDGLYGCAVIHALLFMLLWMFLYVFVFPVVNGFRRSIHTVVIILG